MRLVERLPDGNGAKSGGPGKIHAGTAVAGTRLVARLTGALAGRRGGVADRRRGEKAGLPEQDELLQTAENARENGRDHGVQRRRQPSTILPR